MRHIHTMYVKDVMYSDGIQPTKITKELIITVFTKKKKSVKELCS